MDYLVRHQVGGLVEVLATGAALELPLFAVGGEVKGQVGGRDEGFAAQPAAVRVQARVPVRPPAIGEAGAHLARRTPGRFLAGRGRRAGRIGVRLQWGEAASTV